MPVTLEILTGPRAGQQVTLQPGQTLQVGRVDAADFIIREDAMMSNVHFALHHEGTSCRLSDLNSRFGTLLNGSRVGEAEIHDGDRITAGQTTFVVRLTDAAAPPAPAPSPSVPRAAEATGREDRLLQLLRGEREPLFVLLDAARSPMVLACLQGCKERYQSLYEGVQGDLLFQFAPYLVELPARSPFLEMLVRQGWGKSWGVYLTCARPFEEVRKHFRRFLLVKSDEGKEMYFRYYDPRVLRVFLPTCTAREAAEFFGPVVCYLAEDSRGDNLLRFTTSRQSIVTEPVALVPQPGR
jgi:hypothetical protein